MVRSLVFLALAALFALSGCARHQDNADLNYGKGNLDPELTELDNLKFSRGRPLTAEERKVLSSHSEIKFHLSVEENEQVARFVQYFLENKRETVSRWLTRAEPHLQYVRAVLASHKLPQDLIALPFIESGYNNFAYSSAGAGGMWQFMPATGKRFGLRVDYWVDERRNPYLATVAAAKYLADLNARFGDWQLALAGYNAGEGKVSRAMAASGSVSFNELAKDETLLREETRNYVPKFLAMLKVFKNLKMLGFKTIDMDCAPNLVVLDVPGGTDLAGLAQSCGMDWEFFRALNPGFRRQVSPPGESYPIYLPGNKMELAKAYIDAPGTKPKAGYRMVACAQGDTWWKVSGASGVPVAALRQLNPGLPDVLGPGMSVAIPADSCPLDTSMTMLAEDKAKPAHSQDAVQHSSKAAIYRAQKGDTIKSVAARFGLTESELAAANTYKRKNLAQGDVLFIPEAKAKGKAHIVVLDPKNAQTAKDHGKPQGQVAAKEIKPEPKGKGKGGKDESGDTGGKKKGKYMVAKGETVWSIARKLNVSPHSLLAINNLTPQTHLREGDTLTVENTR